MKNRIYHIYGKNEVLFHSLEEEEFKLVWDTLNHMIDLMNTDYELSDLSYIKVDTLESEKEGSILEHSY